MRLLQSYGTFSRDSASNGNAVHDPTRFLVDVSLHYFRSCRYISSVKFHSLTQIFNFWFDVLRAFRDLASLGGQIIAGTPSHI